jgi:hypothetical protein
MKSLIRKQFISNKRQLLLAGLLALIVVGAISAFYYDRAFPKRTVHPEQAITKGLSYLRHTSDTVSPFQWLLLDYLQRKFELDPFFSASGKTIEPPTGRFDVVEFNIQTRIAYPDKLINSLPIEGASPMRQMVMAATHCDYIPLSPNFDKLLQKNIESGGYDLTHVAYSLERMKENGCALPAEQNIRSLVAKRIAALITDKQTSRDLRYESVALLMHMHRRDLVKPQWIDQIVTEQQPSGGWKVNLSDEGSNDHATVLALWALLEYMNPDAPNEPVLRRPA